jgi:hypothetical protein
VIKNQQEVFNWMIKQIYFKNHRKASIASFFERKNTMPRGTISTIRHLWKEVPSIEATRSFLDQLGINLIEERLELLKLLEEKNAPIGLVLSNGLYYEGNLSHPLNKGQVRIRLKQSWIERWRRVERFVAVQPRCIKAIKFIVGPDFKTVPFAPYQGYHLPTWLGYPTFNSAEFHLYFQFWDLLNYLWEGKEQKCLKKAELILSTGNKFKGQLEIASADRVLMALDEKTPDNRTAYLDVHPLDVSAIHWKVKDENWPYDPTAC